VYEQQRRLSPGVGGAVRNNLETGNFQMGHAKSAPAEKAQPPDIHQQARGVTHRYSCKTAQLLRN
jgi:hypothetical protein